MNRILLILVLTLAFTHLNSEVRAAESSTSSLVLKVNQKDLPATIRLRDSLRSVLKEEFLFGDSISNMSQHGGNTESDFYSVWKTSGRITIERDSQHQIRLIIPEDLKVGYKENIKAIKAQGNDSTGWSPGDSFEFQVQITGNTADNQTIMDNVLSNISVISIILSVLNLILIISLYNKRSNQKSQEEAIKEGDKSKKQNESLQYLTKEETQKIIDSSISKLKEEIEEKYISTSKPVIPTNEETTNEETTTPTKTEKYSDLNEITETFDNLEYKCSENKFVKSDRSSKFFIFHRKGNNYTFTIKEEKKNGIMNVLDSYKCIETRGNKSDADNISSIIPGTISPTGDGNSFTITTRIIIYLN